MDTWRQNSTHARTASLQRLLDRQLKADSRQDRFLSAFLLRTAHYDSRSRLAGRTGMHISNSISCVKAPPHVGPSRTPNFVPVHERLTLSLQDGRNAL